MYPIIWYVLLMALCTAYAARTSARWGPPARTFLDWPQAALAAGSIILAALVISRADLTGFRLASAVIHCGSMAMAVLSGLVGWHRSRAWVVCCSLASLVLVSTYFAWPDPLNNPTLVAVALGMSLLGRTTTRKGFIVGYALLLLFDVYAVSFSGLMNAVAAR